MSQQPPSNPNQPPFTQYPQQGPQGQFPVQGNYPPPQGYPQQPYQQPSMMPLAQPPKKKRGKGLLIGAIVLVVALALCGVVGSLFSHSTPATTSTKVGNVSNTAPTAIPTQTSSYKVGDVVKVGINWTVTLNTAKVSAGDSTFTPKSGMRYLIFDVSMVNLSNKKQVISSIIDFVLRGNDGTKYDITIYPNAGSQIDGSVDAGQPAKGVIVYEVPMNVSAFHLTFESNAFDTSAPSAIWNVKA